MKRRSSRPPVTLGAAVRSLCLMIAALALVACHKGSAANTGSYTIGGPISGLTAGSVVLINGTTTVTITASSTLTSWVFGTAFTGGSSYAVAVLTQPIGEVCEVTNDAAGASLAANLTDVAVTCTDYGQWMWEGGANTVNASGVYGTQGAASASNVPGGRYAASSWIDLSGDFWLFGGGGYASAGGAGYLNDLWKYNPSTSLWTWVSGDNGENASGVYGTVGTAAATNLPGARYSSSSWIDAAGNLWLFGGYGYDSTGAVGKLNDLWRYSPSTQVWTWISGGNTDDAAGVYGTQGTAAAANVPGARYSASSWIDSTGNLWLFGGYGYDAAGGVGSLNDLWRFSPTTNEWTWVGGGSGDNATGAYGARGAASAANVVGARQAANSWVDSSGNLWLFGGYGFGSTGASGYLNDLWQYSPSTGSWTWVGGGDTENASGVYGMQGTAAAANVLGGRQAANSWVDKSGNFWLFGGYGYDAAGTVGALDDLWEYSPSTAQWTWVNGGTGNDGDGGYGTQGTASASNAPGARQAANSWYDASGKLWLFGGAGYASTGNGYLNDLWQFVPPQ
jgi:N-acetylneuraminic acid mutarotase